MCYLNKLQNAGCNDKDTIHFLPVSGSFEKRHDSSVVIATRYGLNGLGIKSLWAARFSAPVQTGSRAHPASYKMDTGSFSGVKRSGVDHPSHLAPRLKKEYSYTSTPPLGLRSLF